VLLDRGRVVERGSHASLLAADGRYAAALREQSGTLRSDVRTRDIVLPECPTLDPWRSRSPSAAAPSGAAKAPWRSRAQR
jgi:hypothetical protein